MTNNNNPEKIEIFDNAHNEYLLPIQSLTDSEYKEIFFERLFERQVNRYTNSKNGMLLDSKLACTHSGLNYHMFTLHNKHKNRISKENFEADYVLHAYLSIQKFDIIDGSSWQAILDGSDKLNFNRLIKNIKTTTTHEIQRAANPNSKYTKAKLNGDKSEHVVIKLEFDSLDKIMLSSDGEETTASDFITDDNNIFASENGEYYLNFYIDWFESNKRHILTPTQLKFLEDLKKCRRIKGLTENDVYEVTGTQSHKVNTRLKRIQDRLLKAWNLDFDKPAGLMKVKNRLEMERDKKIELLAQVIAIASDKTNKETLDLRLSNWFKKHHNNTLIMDLMDYTNKGKRDKTIATNRFLNGKEEQVPHDVLVQFLINARVKQHELKRMDCKVKAFEQPAPTKNERDYNDDLMAVTVTDKNGNTKVTVDESMTPAAIAEAKKKDNIIYIMPNGVNINNGNTVSALY